MENFIPGSSNQGGTEVHSNCLRCKKPIRCFYGAQSWVHPLSEGVHGIAHGEDQVSSLVHDLCQYDLVGKDERLESTLERGDYVNLGPGQRIDCNYNSGEVMNHMKDLENQIRLAKNENLEMKRALTHIFYLAQATHMEVKHHNSKIAERVSNLEEAMGDIHTHEVRKEAKSEAVNSKNTEAGRKLDKLKNDMVNTGLQADTSSSKDGSADPTEDAFLDTSLHS